MFFLNACGPPTPPEVSAKKDPTPTPQIVEAETETSNELDTVYFLNRMAHLRTMAVHRPNEEVKMISSHSDEDTPEDANVYQGDSYKIDGTMWNVLADSKGPGCITRFWISATPEAKLRFYFDNEPEPRIECTVKEFFSNEIIKSNGFLIFDQSQSGGGYFSYFPMPYAEHITVLIDNSPEEIKYQISLLTMDTTKPVRSFTPEFDDRTTQAVKHVQNQLSPERLNELIAMQMREVKELNLNAGEQKMALNLVGPAAIQYFQIDTSTMDAATLNQVRIKCYWDDYQDAFVDCTLAEFFGHNQKQRRWFTSLLGYVKEQDFGYSRFYMPFHEKAQVYFHNESDTNVTLNAKFQLDQKTPPSNFSYFYARNDKRQFLHGMTYPLFEFEGQGKFIGWNLFAVSQPLNGKHFILEGDEFFYIDGEAQPSWAGTGLDNYFNSDDRFQRIGFYFTPFCGLLGQDSSGGGSINAIRLHYLDAIPFDTSLLMLQEIGSPQQYIQTNSEQATGANYSWTVFWYGIPTDQKPTREERVFYYTVSKEKSQPSQDAPVTRDLHLKLKLPNGTWWVNIAPIWNITDVQHIRQEVGSAAEIDAVSQ